MTPAAELTCLLAEWRRLTELEWQAILHDHWPELARHQQDKARLRPHITQALQQVRAAQSPQQTPVDTAAEPFGAAASELVALQKRNRDAIHAKCRNKRAELQGLSQTIRNLQDVRRAYGGQNAHLWQSYS
jgi:hypothetical protein